MNRDRTDEGNWKHLKSDAKQQRGMPGGNKLDAIVGELEHLAPKIRAKYGLSRVEAEKQLAEWQASHQQTVSTRTA